MDWLIEIFRLLVDLQCDDPGCIPCDQVKRVSNPGFPGFLGASKQVVACSAD